MGQLEELENFVAIAEAGGIGRAAERSGQQKSAVSRKLTELEKRLGVQLMVRTTRTWHLTEAGQRCYQQALKVIDAHRELAQSLNPAPEAITGELRVAAPQSFGQQQLPGLLAGFAGRYPGLTLHLTLSDKFIDLVQDGMDVALRIGNTDTRLRARNLCPIHLCLVASPDYLARAGHPTQPDALDQHQILHFTGHQGAIPLRSADGELISVTGNSRIHANDGHLLNALAVAGQGIALAPRFISYRDLAAGRLVELLPDCALPARQLQAVYPAGRFVPQKVRLFIDYLAEQLQPTPDWA